MASGHGRLSIFGFNLYFVRFCSFEQVKDALGAKNQFSGLWSQTPKLAEQQQQQCKGSGGGIRRHEKQPNWFSRNQREFIKTEEQQREVQGEEVMAEGHSRSKQGLEGECAGCISSLPRSRSTRVGGLGLGGLGGWSEEEKVCSAF